MIKSRKNSGFTLIEVLISMVVLAVGLLGLAGLQATSLKNNLSAFNRGQATQLAYDLSDRMRANSAAAANYVTTFMAPGDATVQASCTTPAGCTITQMAEHDLYEWNTALSATIPGAAGEILFAGSIYTIIVSWDDNRDDSIDDNDPNFQMSFELL